MKRQYFREPAVNDGFPTSEPLSDRSLPSVRKIRANFHGD